MFVEFGTGIIILFVFPARFDLCSSGYNKYLCQMFYTINWFDSV